MANMREGLAATSLASLEWSPDVERAVDRVAASGRASRLGIQIWKARYMLESQAYRDAADGLTAHFCARYKAEQPEMARRIVDEVLSEYMGPSCTTCMGARELITRSLRVVCTSCGGSGLKLYTDQERAGRMKISMQHVRLLERKMAWLMGEVGQMDRAVNSIIASELERD